MSKRIEWCLRPALCVVAMLGANMQAYAQISLPGEGVDPRDLTIREGVFDVSEISVHVPVRLEGMPASIRYATATGAADAELDSVFVSCVVSREIGSDRYAPSLLEAGAQSIGAEGATNLYAFGAQSLSLSAFSEEQQILTVPVDMTKSEETGAFWPGIPGISIDQFTVPEQHWACRLAFTGGGYSPSAADVWFQDVSLEPAADDGSVLLVEGTVH